MNAAFRISLYIADGRLNALSAQGPDTMSESLTLDGGQKLIGKERVQALYLNHQDEVVCHSNSIMKFTSSIFQPLGRFKQGKLSGR